MAMIAPAHRHGAHAATEPDRRRARRRLMRRSHVAAAAAYLAVFTAPGVGGTVARWSDQASSGTLTFSTGTWSDDAAHLDIRVTPGVWEAQPLAIVDVFPGPELDPALIIEHTAEFRVGESDGVGAEQLPAVFEALTPASARRFAFSVDVAEVVASMQEGCLTGRLVGGTFVSGCARLLDERPEGQPETPDDTDAADPAEPDEEAEIVTGDRPEPPQPEPEPHPIGEPQEIVAAPPPEPVEAPLEDPPVPPSADPVTQAVAEPAQETEEPGEEPEPPVTDPVPTDLDPALELPDVEPEEDLPAGEPVEPVADQTPVVSVATRP